MASGQALRFALQADGSSLATGMYDYSVSVGTKYGTTWTYQTFSGKQAIVNRSTSEYGNGWWLDGLSTLKDSSAGALLVRGNGIRFGSLNLDRPICMQPGIRTMGRSSNDFVNFVSRSCIKSLHDIFSSFIYCLNASACSKTQASSGW